MDLPFAETLGTVFRACAPLRHERHAGPNNDGERHLVDQASVHLVGRKTAVHPCECNGS
jgi:hypothetical protein